MIEQFVDLLNRKEVIGFPTETVYGLGADATSEKAVSKVFDLKKRPRFNPLIIHVYSLQEAENYGLFSFEAKKLADFFWYPSENASSLTLVVPLREHVNLSKLSLSGLDSVALRVPNHKIALDLLKNFGGPIAAPSANLYQNLSPTSSIHVKKYFPDLPILEGGECCKGLESTIIDCTHSDISILRYGALNIEAIEDVLEKKIKKEIHQHIKAPGMIPKHYAPKKKLRINANGKLDNDEILIGFGSIECDLNLSVSADLLEAAANLFKYLHEVDQKDCEGIAVTAIPNVGLGRAINDRLEKAAFKG